MRVLIVSDIHSNLVALEAVLRETAGEYDAVWNLGDTIGYGPRPNECMAVMQSLPTTSIAGNHDLACIGSSTVNIAEFNNDARVANIWNGRQLKTTYKQFLNQLPLARSMDDQFYIVHGSPKDPVWEYLLRPYQAEDNWQAIPHQTCFIGHSHVQIYIRRNIDGSAAGPIMPTPGEVMLLDSDERYFINPGSVGQPRDGDPRAAYAILDTSAQQITFGRVAYDIASTQQQMLEYNLPLMLIRRLQFGR